MATDETRALVDEIESQRETIRSLHTALDDLTRAGLEMELAKNEEIAVLRADLARARRNAAHFEQLFENVEKARAWFSRELDAARTAVGEAWFTGGVTLAEAIERKCRALESDAAKAAAEVKRLQGPSEEPKSEIKRYDTTTVYIGCGEYVGYVEETEDGDYVLFDDHRAIVERLRARVAELEEERLVKDEAEPKSVEEPAEWAWYYDGSRVQGDGFATREEAIRDAVIGHEAERFLVGPMRDLDLAEWVDAADIAERISESICDNLGLEDIRVYAGPAAQAALEAWARTNLSPDPSRYCEGEPVTMDEVRSTQKGGADG